MPAKPAAKKTTSDRWESRTATKAAVDKFEEEFEKSMGISLRKKSPQARIVTTGSMNLDYALTVGGVPTGRIVEVWGPEHAGKTTLAILQAVQFQREFPNKRVAWVDMEQTFDDPWAIALGLDLAKVWFMTPKNAEDVADAVKRFTSSGLCSLVVLDSVGGMIAKVEFDKESDEQTVGIVPKVVTRMVKQCSPMAKSNGTLVYVINQVRASIGGFGPDEITGGGWALKHVTTMKMQVKRAGGEGTGHTISIDGKQVPVGHKIAVRVQKNKMAPPGMVAELWLHNRETEAYGPIGIDPIPEVFDFGKRLKLMGSGAGGNYEVEGTKVKGGEPKVLDHLREHPEVVAALRAKILATLAGKVTVEAEDDPDPLGIAEMVG